MSDLKLFRITNGSAQELKGKSVVLELWLHAFKASESASSLAGLLCL